MTQSEGGAAKMVFPFPRDVRYPLDPAPELIHLLHDRPISKVTLCNDRSAWLVTRMDDVRTVLGSADFTVTTTHENTPSVSAAVEARKHLDASFQRKDAPAHTRERRVWQRMFSAAKVEAVKPRIQAFVDEVLDDLLAAGSPGDLVDRVAVPLPSKVILELLDIPQTDRAFVLEQSAALANARTPLASLEPVSKNLFDYWRQLIAARLANPGDDPISEFVLPEVRNGQLTESEVVSGALLIQFAGQHTTANSISLGVLTLLQHPHLIHRIRDDSSVLPQIVEELLRYLTIVHNGSARVALTDVQIGDVTIRKGDGVIAHLAAANRDENAFKDPDMINPDRAERQHAAFGSGPHICIGAPLARVELQMMFKTLFTRVPTLRFATPLHRIEYKMDGLFFGLNNLPVAW